MLSLLDKLSRQRRFNATLNWDRPEEDVIFKILTSNCILLNNFVLLFMKYEKIDLRLPSSIKGAYFRLSIGNTLQNIALNHGNTYIATEARKIGIIWLIRFKLFDQNGTFCLQRNLCPMSLCLTYQRLVPRPAFISSVYSKASNLVQVGCFPLRVDTCEVFTFMVRSTLVTILNISESNGNRENPYLASKLLKYI